MATKPFLPPISSRPGRRGTITPEIITELSEKVANGSSMKDALALAGIPAKTGSEWLRVGAEMERLPVEQQEALVPGAHQDMCLRLSVALGEAKARRRLMLKLLISRAARGTTRRPGDWRAAQALGAITDPDEFVPQVRVHVTGQINAVLDALQEAFRDEPEIYERALHAISSGARGPESSGAPDEPIAEGEVSQPVRDEPQPEGG